MASSTLRASSPIQFSLGAITRPPLEDAILHPQMRGLFLPSSVLLHLSCFLHFLHTESSFHHCWSSTIFVLHFAIVESSFHGRGSSIHVVVAPCKFGILLQRLLVLRDYCFCAFKPWSPPSMNGLHPSALLLHPVFEKSCFHNSLSSNNFGSAFPSLGVLLL